LSPDEDRSALPKRRLAKKKPRFGKPKRRSGKEKRRLGKQKHFLGKQKPRLRKAKRRSSEPGRRFGKPKSEISGVNRQFFAMIVVFGTTSRPPFPLDWVPGSPWALSLKIFSFYLASQFVISCNGCR
jgi:hypothetical protein